METRRDVTDDPRGSAGPGGSHVRRCLSCGHGGRSLQGERGRLIYACPACDADLYARPPMSYAEMEGLPTPGRHRRAVLSTLRGLWRRLARVAEARGRSGSGARLGTDRRASGADGTLTAGSDRPSDPMSDPRAGTDLVR
jgi:hypothetical protein